jgi:hypothetical protein
MNYEKMSDLEINYAVASILFKVVDGDIGSSVCAGDTGKGDLNLYDYCSNPADMWPIIVEHKISIINYPSGDAATWIQGSGFANFKSEDKNALRSAAITFLMMQEKEV